MKNIRYYKVLVFLFGLDRDILNYVYGLEINLERYVLVFLLDFVVVVN